METIKLKDILSRAYAKGYVDGYDMGKIDARIINYDRGLSEGIEIEKKARDEVLK